MQHNLPEPALLETWPNWSVPLSSAPRIVRLLGAGQTNESWLLDTDQGMAVLRVGNEQASDLGIDRQREALILKALSDKPYVPTLWYMDPVVGIQVTQYLEGDLFDTHSLPAQLHGSLRDIIADFQGTALPSWAMMNYYQYLQAYWVYCENRGAIEKRWVPEWMSFLPTLEAFQRSDWRRVLVHSDLEGQNLLVKDDKIVIIDWEYAHGGHPGFDACGWGTHSVGADEEMLKQIKFWFNRLWLTLRESQP